MEKFSVVIPTYNRCRLLGRAIDSVLAQSLPPSQVIVVDDGSADHTEEVCSKYSGRIEYVRQPNSGVSVARNRGIQLARHPWIAFLDSDDYWTPAHLEKIGAAIAATGGKGRFYFTDMQLPSGTGASTLWSKVGINFSAPFRFVEDGTSWMLMSWQPCSLQSTVFNAGVLKLSGGFDPRFRIREDTEMFCRLGINGPICLVNNVGCIQTADDTPENRLSEIIHVRSEAYWRQECLLCTSLISRFPNLKPGYRQTLYSHLAIASWRLFRLHFRSGRFVQSARDLCQAAAARPTFFKDVLRPYRENVRA